MVGSRTDNTGMPQKNQKAAVANPTPAPASPVKQNSRV